MRHHMQWTLALLFIGLNTAGVFSNPMCENEMNYFVDESSGCQDYYICINGHYEKKTCPDGFLFSRNTGTCEWKQLVSDCQKIIQCSIPDGEYLKESTGCKTFISCTNGRGVEMECPDGQIYNEESGSCDWEELVECKSKITQGGYKRPDPSTDTSRRKTRIMTSTTKSSKRTTWPVKTANVSTSRRSSTMIYHKTTNTLSETQDVKKTSEKTAETTGYTKIDTPVDAHSTINTEVRPISTQRDTAYPTTDVPITTRFICTTRPRETSVDTQTPVGDLTIDVSTATQTGMTERRETAPDTRRPTGISSTTHFICTTRPGSISIDTQSTIAKPVTDAKTIGFVCNTRPGDISLDTRSPTVMATTNTPVTSRFICTTRPREISTTTRPPTYKPTFKRTKTTHFICTTRPGSIRIDTRSRTTKPSTEVPTTTTRFTCTTRPREISVTSTNIRSITDYSTTGRPRTADFTDTVRTEIKVSNTQPSSSIPDTDIPTDSEVNKDISSLTTETTRKCKLGSRYCEPDRDLCPQEFGEIAHPDDPNLFVHCDHWKPFIKNCPPSLHFNPDLKICEWPRIHN